MFPGFHSKPLLALLVVVVSNGCLFAGKEFLAGPHDQVASDQLLVGLRFGADINQVLGAVAPQAAASRIGAQNNVFLLKLPPGVQAAVSKRLAAHPSVNYVEPNRIRPITVLPPNDTWFNQQWNLIEINALQAWSYFPDS